MIEADGGTWCARAIRPDWRVGAAGLDAVSINGSERPRHPDHHTNVRNLLRNPTIDLLLVEL